MARSELFIRPLLRASLARALPLMALVMVLSRSKKAIYLTSLSSLVEMVAIRVIDDIKASRDYTDIKRFCVIKLAINMEWYLDRKFQIHGWRLKIMYSLVFDMVSLEYQQQQPEPVEKVYFADGADIKETVICNGFRSEEKASSKSASY